MTDYSHLRRRRVTNFSGIGFFFLAGRPASAGTPVGSERGVEGPESGVGWLSQWVGVAAPSVCGVLGHQKFAPAGRTRPARSAGRVRPACARARARDCVCVCAGWRGARRRHAPCRSDGCSPSDSLQQPPPLPAGVRAICFQRCKKSWKAWSQNYGK